MLASLKLDLYMWTAHHKWDRKKYSTFTEKSRDGVKRMLAFIKEVWCDDNKEQLQYVLKWFAALLKGHKNQSIL
jgi:hypothetical protein